MRKTRERDDFKQRPFTTAFTLISAGFPAAELDVIIILLLPLALRRFVVRLAAGARTKYDSDNEQVTEILFHGLRYTVNTTRAHKRTPFVLIFRLLDSLAVKRQLKIDR